MIRQRCQCELRQQTAACTAYLSRIEHRPSRRSHRLSPTVLFIRMLRRELEQRFDILRASPAAIPVECERRDQPLGIRPVLCKCALHLLLGDPFTEADIHYCPAMLRVCGSCDILVVTATGGLP